LVYTNKPQEDFGGFSLMAGGDGGNRTCFFKRKANLSLDEKRWL
jgi:hypothetical protein